MKTRKSKLTSLLKTGLLLFGISLLLWNCEQESVIEEQQIVVEDTINPLFAEFRSQFNYNSFEETIPYQYEVNWAYSIKQYSEDLQTNFYEFDLIYADAFNPIRINKIGPKKHNIIFKLIAVENQDQEYDFYIAKFFQEKASGISIDVLQPSLNTETGYKGVTHLYNSNNDIVFAKFVSADNNENLKKYVHPIFKKKTDNDLKGFKESFVYVTKCETVTVHHYIDWYYYEFDDWGNIANSYYSHTTYAGSSTTEECTTEWVPHPRDYGDGGLFGTGVGCDEAGECIEDVVDALIEESEIDIVDDSDPNNIDYNGVKELIPNPLILDNGRSIEINFGTTSDGVNANQLVAKCLIYALKHALEQESSINSIHIHATTNGHNNYPNSNHLRATAIDISRINGIKIINLGNSSQVSNLQNAFDSYHGIRENFGPNFKHKTYSDGSINLDFNVSGHNDHIHISIQSNTNCD